METDRQRQRETHTHTHTHTHTRTFTVVYSLAVMETVPAYKATAGKARNTERKNPAVITGLHHNGKQTHLHTNVRLNTPTVNYSTPSRRKMDF